MARAFDLSWTGDEELIKAFDSLERRTQGKILRPVFKQYAAKDITDRVLLRVPVRTGALLRAFGKRRVKAASKRNTLRVGLIWPGRVQDGGEIDIPDPKWYYPAHVEYGHGNTPARPFLRPAIDHYVNRDREKLARLIGAQIVKSYERSTKLKAAKRRKRVA